MQDQTSERMTAVRAACFRWYEQCHRTAQVRGVPIYARGRQVRHPDYVAPIGASEERYARGIGTRGYDALRAAAVPTVRNRAAHRDLLVSPARFLTWYLPRFYAAVLPVPNVASDALAAVAYAGLVDVGRVGFDRYLVTPRDAVPTWEIDTQVKPSPTPRVKPFHGTEQVTYGRLTDAEYARGQSGYVPRVMVPIGVYEAALVDPMRYFPAAMSLGREAQTFFTERGEKMPLVDTYDVHRHRWNSGPDRVAHRGTARVRRAAPNRYQRGTKEVRDAMGRKALAPALDLVVIGNDGQYELETRLTRRYYCSCGPLVTPTGVVLEQTGHFNADPRKCVCVPRGWVGHRRVTFGDSTRGTIAKAKVVKAKVGRRAPNVAAGPWSMSERSLARATRTLGDAVLATELAIRRLGDGQSFTFDDGTRVTLHGAAQVFDATRLRTYPVREWSRRHVLEQIARD